MVELCTTLAFGLLLSTGLACATTRAHEPIGFSGVSGESTLKPVEASADSAPPSSRPPVFSDWRDVIRFVSRGHVPLANSGQESQIVASSETVADAYLRRSNDAAFPSGSGLAQLFASEAAGPWTVAYVMQRTRNDWRYLVATPEGAVGEERSHLCAACHEQRPARAVFGPPSAATGAVPPKTATK